MGEKIFAKKGLEDTVIDTTTISQVNPETNSLLYRGYPAQDLAEVCSFEEVVYLLWYGELPSAEQLKKFTQRERELRPIDDKLLSLIRMMDPKTHPMDAIRTCVSFLGSQDLHNLTLDRDMMIEKSLNLLAKVPTCIFAFNRIRKGQEPIAPSSELSFAENIFHMNFGEVPDQEEIKTFEVSLVTYAEHSFNASTFTSRVITSTQSDMYSAVTGAIGALKGKLHGGANEEVMYMLMNIQDPLKAREWLQDALKQKKKIMGFGHRVYKWGDSRVPILNKYTRRMSARHGDETWMAILFELERTMLEEKNIQPNVDFPTGPAYYLMGFDIDLFTPIFVLARVAGWTTHVMEQAQNNKLIRPLGEYVGEKEREVIPLEKRNQ